MCDLQWDPLAELYLTKVDWINEIYCLCSRVFTRSKEDKNNKLTIDVDDLSASENDDRDDDVIQLLDEPIDHSQHTNSDIKHDFDPEIVSCYCSASHTDNISTDEHDSLRDSHSIRPILHKGIQSSDSGADLTEHLKSDQDASWQKYWAKHGERLIWDSWIEKYSDYINPEYLVICDSETNEQVALEPKENDNFNFKAEHSKTRFSFDKKDIEKVETNLSIIDENAVLTENGEYKVQDVASKNRMLVRNLSGSDSYDKLNTDISEGWNPLSPLSIDCETEAERLLSSRCGSYASGSVRTVDSMTNVTRMTVSSLDLSESSKTSDSFSSVSSVQSSLSSSSDDFDENAEFDVQWNILWKKHYEEEYLEQYKNFILETGKLDEDISEIKREENFLSHKNVIQSMKILGIERKNSNTSSIDDSESNSKKSKHKRVSRKSIESVGHLLNNLRMEEDEKDEIEDKNNVLKKSNEKSTSLEDDSMQYVRMQDLDESHLNTLGLPISFGKSKHSKQDSLPKSFSADNLQSDVSDQSASNRIKAAFNLMGIELNEGDESKFKGQVDYKMKHIRLQNRQLKLNHNRNNFTHKPKHTYFDDDGEEIAEDRESDEVIQQDNITDNSENKPSSSSNDEEENENSMQFGEEVKENADVMPLSRKRKRKRKLALPPEIKENPKLKKYWQRRFSLFNKFDLGIKLDEESWYSVTPEQVAKHTAKRCQCDIIVDAFCGAGGNSIQFAFTCERVIAVDIDPKKIELARNNAEVYGVADRIEFIVGDFFKLAETLKADAVFLSPPWGGPKYLNLATYELEEMLEPAPLSELLLAARKISENLAVFLPKNSNTYALLKAAGSGGFVEIEQNFINKKLIAITAYYNDLIKQI